MKHILGKSTSCTWKTLATVTCFLWQDGSCWPTSRYSSSYRMWNLGSDRCVLLLLTYKYHFILLSNSMNVFTKANTHFLYILVYLLSDVSKCKLHLLVCDLVPFPFYLFSCSVSPYRADGWHKKLITIFTYHIYLEHKIRTDHTVLQ